MGEADDGLCGTLILLGAEEADFGRVVGVVVGMGEESEDMVELVEEVVVVRDAALVTSLCQATAIPTGIPASFRLL
jgi:hypothetical protein